MKAEIVELRNKAIVVKVRADRERRASSGQDFVAEAKFVFISKKNGEFASHGLELI